MVKVRFTRVEIDKKSGNTWAGSSTHLPFARNVMVKRGIGKVKDTFDFKLTNAHNTYFESGGIKPDEDDKIRVWFWSDTPWSSLATTEKNFALQIDGIITDVTQTTSTGREISIKGTSFFDLIFKGLVFVRDKNLTLSHTIIQNVISQLNSINPNRVIYGANSSEWTALGNDETTKTIQYTSSYKSVIEIIEDLSTNKYTGDGDFKYLVKYNIVEDRYDFLWNRKGTTESLTLVEGISNIQNLKLNKNKDEVVNAVIYNVGFDANEVPHDFLYFDPSKIVSGGGSWKYITTETQDVTQDLITAEYEADRTKWEETTDGTRKENYPKDGDFPWTFQFNIRNDDGTYQSTTATASNDDDYNDAIVDEAEWVGKFRVMDIIDRFGEAKWGGSIVVPQSNETNEGELISLTSASYDFSSKKLRMNEIHNDLNVSIYKTKEDAESTGIK